MCGITGFKGFGTKNDLEKMTSVISHRGPDSNGVFFEEINTKNNIALGHTRLSIIDLSPLGSQPMFSDDQNLVIVFNGEIYNFQDLRKDLESKNYQFKGHSDTEVIIYLYQEYGYKCFAMLDGMFAIALYDKQNDKIILARDPLGKKPLYYTFQNNNFVFGSELKTLRKYQSIKFELNNDILPTYFANDFIPTPYTIYKNVFKLEPGTYLTLVNNEIKKEKYWDIYPPQSPLVKGGRQDPNYFSDLFENAVKKRMVSDVPLGVFLSGGLDSSMVTYYANKIAKENNLEKIKTFSISFNEKSFDESMYASQVSEYLNTDHRNYVFTVKDVEDEIKNLANVLDEPIGDSSILPTLILSKFTKQYVTVALGGDGGDELFAGYPTFQMERVLNFLKIVPTSILVFTSNLILKLPLNNNRNMSLQFKLQKILDGLQEKNIYKRHLKWLGAFNPYEVNLLLKNNSQDNYSFLQQYELPDISKDKNNLLKMYARTYMMDEVLVKVDRTSMHYALETRTPFLDKSFVQSVFNIPYNLKLKFFTTKYLLKKMAEGKLPNNIIYRAKKGFGIPLTKWLKTDLKYLLDDYLVEKYLPKEIFNIEYIQQLKFEHLSNTFDHRKKLWNLIVFAIWYKKWILNE